MIEIARDDLVRLMAECRRTGRESLATISTDKDTLSVVAASPDVSYYGSAACSGDGLACTVDPGRIGTFLATCEGDFAKLETKKDTVIVTCGAATAKVATLDYEVAGTEPPQVAMTRIGEASTLCDSLYAMPKDANRPSIARLRLDRGKALTTDGHRIAIIDDTGTTATLTIPPYLAKRAASCLREADIAIGNTATQCVMTWRGQTWVQPLPAGEFPDWRAVVPDSWQGMGTTINAPDLAAAVGVVLTMTHDDIITIEKNGGKTVVVTAGEGESSATCEVKAEGPALKCTLNGRYLTQALDTSGNAELAVVRNGGMLAVVQPGKRDFIMLVAR